MGQALRGDVGGRGAGRFAAARRLIGALLCSLLLLPTPLVAQRAVPNGAPAGGIRLDSSRFTVVADPRDERLARTLLATAIATDTFPGLPRPRARVLLAIAPDAERFRAWVGPHAPEWGAAIAFPHENRIVMQGSRAGSGAGEPRTVLRHELAHLALHEALGDLPPRWFDEGYASVAAAEWSREETIATSVGMVWRGLPDADSLDALFFAGATDADWGYALAHRVVSELASLDTANGLDNYMREWKASGSREVAMRRAFGITVEQFDRLWRSRTRRRYGALALVTNVSLAVGFFGILLGPLFVARRRRDRRRLEAMRAQDAAQELAERESMLQAMLDTAPAEAPAPHPPRPPA